VDPISKYLSSEHLLYCEIREAERSRTRLI
jgi:hypothetical protein